MRTVQQWRGGNVYNPPLAATTGQFGCVCSTTRTMKHECPHEMTVEQLLNVLATVGTLRPAEIRDAVAACEALCPPNVVGLLGAQTIDVKLTPPDNNIVYKLRSRTVTLRSDYEEEDNDDDDDDDTAAADAFVADELSRALQLVFANPALCHGSVRSQCKNRRVTPVVTVRISERYCHRTLYWLCEILALVCVKFTVRLRTPRPRSMTEARSLLLSAILDTDITKVDARLTLFREELANLRGGISRDCRYCVGTMLREISMAVESMTANKYDVATILVTSEFVRFYRKMKNPKLWSLCDRHRRERCNDEMAAEQRYRCCHFPDIIELVLDVPAERSTLPLYTRYAPHRHHTTTTIGDSSVRAIAKFMRDIAVFGPTKVTDYGTLYSSMFGFEIFHRLFSLLPLLGEQSFDLTLTHNSSEAIVQVAHPFE